VAHTQSLWGQLTPSSMGGTGRCLLFTCFARPSDPGASPATQFMGLTGFRPALVSWDLQVMRPARVPYYSHSIARSTSLSTIFFQRQSHRTVFLITLTV
jgi:hypothetical protein